MRSRLKEDHKTDNKSSAFWTAYCSYMFFLMGISIVLAVLLRWKSSPYVYVLCVISRISVIVLYILYIVRSCLGNKNLFIGISQKDLRDSFLLSFLNLGFTVYTFGILFANKYVKGKVLVGGFVVLCAIEMILLISILTAESIKGNHIRKNERKNLVDE